MRNAMLFIVGTGLLSGHGAAADAIDPRSASPRALLIDSSTDAGVTDQDAGEAQLPSCGDGRVEGSEVCDDGRDNGLRPHCAADCSHICTADSDRCFTPIRGELSCDESSKQITWAAPTLHYEIASAVVPAGCTLNIEKGVQIRFRNSAALGIKGTLNITGSESAPVRLRVMPGDSWGWMLWLQEESSATIRHAEIVANKPCIWGNGALTVEHSKFDQCTTGIKWPSRASGELTIGASRFDRCNSPIAIGQLPTVETPGDAGEYDPSRKSIVGNTFYDGGPAITIERSGNVSIRNNLIRHNGGGIVCFECQRTSITDNAIIGNGGAAVAGNAPIFAEDDRYMYYGGIYLRAGPDVAVTRNDIRDNVAPSRDREFAAAGVIVDRFGDRFRFENNNLSSSIEGVPVLRIGPLAQAPATLDAASNYWGPQTTAQMDLMGAGANISAIFDRSDDFRLAAVSYAPFLTSPVPDAGPR